MAQGAVSRRPAPPAATLLLVESDILVRGPLAGYLRACGYRVLEAVNAAEARALLQAQWTPIDLVLADVGLPGAENGFAVAQWIRRNYPNVRVLLAGGVAGAAQKAGEICEEGPMLAKPHAPELLLARIQRLLHQAGKGGGGAR